MTKEEEFAKIAERFAGDRGALRSSEKPKKNRKKFLTRETSGGILIKLLRKRDFPMRPGRISQPRAASAPCKLNNEKETHLWTISKLEVVF